MPHDFTIYHVKAATQMDIAWERKMHTRVGSKTGVGSSMR